MLNEDFPHRVPDALIYRELLTLEKLHVDKQGSLNYFLFDLLPKISEKIDENYQVLEMSFMRDSMINALNTINLICTRLLFEKTPEISVSEWNINPFSITDNKNHFFEYLSITKKSWPVIKAVVYALLSQLPPKSQSLSNTLEMLRDDLVSSGHESLLKYVTTEMEEGHFIISPGEFQPSSFNEFDLIHAYNVNKTKFLNPSNPAQVRWMVANAGKDSNEQGMIIDFVEKLVGGELKAYASTELSTEIKMMRQELESNGKVREEQKSRRGRKPNEKTFREYMTDSPDKEKRLERLHQLIDSQTGVHVARIIYTAKEMTWLIERPPYKCFVAEFGEKTESGNNRIEDSAYNDCFNTWEAPDEVEKLKEVIESGL